MNAEIISVGTELLMGQISNTNAQYISQKLAESGINVYFHSVVGDNRVRMLETLRLAVKRSDILILTGGLGPTEDDITKEVISELTGVPLEVDYESQLKIEEFFNKLNRPMAENNIRQALIPQGAVIIPNDKGLAPGCVVNYNSIDIVLLPGPPSEMKPMFDYFLDKHIVESGMVIESKYIRIFGLGESTVEEKISALVKKQTNPTLATYCNEGEVVLRITASSMDKNGAELLIKPVLEEIEGRLGKYIVSTDGRSMEEVVVSMLREKGKTISTAESCTGGMIGSRLTSVPGASEVYERGVVTYSNNSKVDMLGVSSNTLSKKGAVSPETAEQMARGIREISGTSIGISITGIAGPGGGSEEKPVGLVYIGFSDESGTESRRLNLFGSRDRVRHYAALTALDIVRRKLKQNN